MLPTSVPRRVRAGGFTLVELMIALSLAFIVIAGILAAYLFMARGLTRLAYTQQQEVKSRRALTMFTQDLSSAIQLTTSTSSAITAVVPTASSTTTVTYTYTAVAGNAGTLTRTDSAGTTTLLTDLSAFSFRYYNESGSVVTSSPQSVKSVEFTSTSVLGSALSGTRMTHSTMSPRVVLRNKPALAN
jgi:Tfp pilus assembly protein PilW